MKAIRQGPLVRVNSRYLSPHTAQRFSATSIDKLSQVTLVHRLVVPKARGGVELVSIFPIVETPELVEDAQALIKSFYAMSEATKKNGSIRIALNVDKVVLDRLGANAAWMQEFINEKLKELLGKLECDQEQAPLSLLSDYALRRSAFGSGMSAYCSAEPPSSSQD